MAEAPWLTILGLGEDGPDGLCTASRAALAEAEIVTGAARHLALLPDLACEVQVWPVPFADGLERLEAWRGRRVVVLTSGDPFWYGAGSVLARRFAPAEWRAFPGVSVFSQAASVLGWAIEETVCIGLHAAPLTRLRPHLMVGQRLLVLLRDGGAVADLATYLAARGFGASRLHVLEALGGPRMRVRAVTAGGFDLNDVAHPVCVGLDVAGEGPAVPCAAGRPDDLFAHDGQITKRPVRALTLSALAPRAGEHLWDIGAGSGSVAIEWLLSHRATRATAIEADAPRAARLRGNAAELGVDRLMVIEGRAPDALANLTAPDAVFIGGGLSEALLEHLWQVLPTGTRVVANAVTLESEALLSRWQATGGGTLIRIDIAEARPLGRLRGWVSAYPIVQWSVTR